MKKVFSLFAGLVVLPGLVWGLNLGIKKDHIQKVHSIAIISVYSNAEIIKSDARAGGLTAGIGFLKKMKDKKDNPALGHFGGTDLVQSALDAYAKNLAGVKSWTVVDPKTVLASADYKAFVEDVKKEVGPKGMEMMDKTRSVPDGMVPYLFLNNKDKKKLSQMSDLCAKLKVDSVAIVEMELSQRSTFMTAGVAGKVWPGAAVTLKIVTADGNVAVAAMGPKAEPAAPVEMKMDNMEDTPAARAAFKEAIEKSAAEFKDNLNQNI